MLSHHEFAKLLLISQAPEQVTASHPDVDALLEKSLVELRPKPGGILIARVTGRGISVLRSLGGAAGSTVSPQGGGIASRAC